MKLKIMYFDGGSTSVNTDSIDDVVDIISKDASFFYIKGTPPLIINKSAIKLITVIQEKEKLCS